MCRVSRGRCETPHVGRRAEHKAATHRALADAAVDLALAGGPPATMGRIADAAGVSRRTAYRYAADRDELLLYHPISWLDVFDEAAERHADEPIARRLHLVSLAIAAHIDADAEPVKRAFAVATTDSSFGGAYARLNARWVDRVTAEIARPDDPVAVQLRARMLGAAVMGMIDTVCFHWAAHDEPMAPLIDEGFDLLSSAFAWLD